VLPPSGEKFTNDEALQPIVVLFAASDLVVATAAARTALRATT